MESDATSNYSVGECGLQVRQMFLVGNRRENGIMEFIRLGYCFKEAKPFLTLSEIYKNAKKGGNSCD